MIPGDRLICAFIENRPNGDTFMEWPLHATIVPWFRLDMATSELATKIMQKLSAIEPFMVTVGGEAGFGHRGRKVVNLIETPSPLETIERLARRLLHDHDAWLVDETTKRQHGFRPHVTRQKSGRVQEGGTFTIENLYIVEQKGEYKEVVGRIDL